MASTDHEKIRINKFNGLWNRGTTEDCPLDHFSDCSNVRLIDDTVLSRPPAVLSRSINNIKRIHLYQKRSETSPRFIILNSSGEFFDSEVSLVTPFLTIASATDFSCVTFYDRLYISPHDGKEGIAGERVYVYDGTSARQSAGSGPSTSPTFAAAGAGHVDEGIHLCAYVYETSSGYITRVGSGAGYDAQYIVAKTVTAGQTIEFNNVPVGPAGTTARWVLISKRIDPLAYTGDPLGYELFFATRIANNTATTYSYNKYDSELVQSADYLFNNLTTIPAGVCIGRYNDRLVVGGFGTTANIGRTAPLTDIYTRAYDNRSLMYVSKRGEPESISAVEGFLTVDPTEYTNVRAFAEHRKMMVISKATQCYVTQDNDYEAATWEIVPIDKSIGTECFGLASTVLNRGASADSVIMASYEGLMLYNGIMSEFPLTWKIHEIWRRINKLYMNKVQVVQDGQSRTIYVNVPLDSSTDANYLLVGDYSKGLNHEDIRWTIWDFSNISLNPQSIALYIDSANKFQLAFAGANNVYSIGLATDVVDYRDLGTTAVNAYFKTALIALEQDSVHHLAAVGARYTAGPLSLIGWGDGAFSVALPTMPSRSSYSNIAVWSNVKADKIAVTFQCNTNTAAARLSITEVTLYVKQLWYAKPI